MFECSHSCIKNTVLVASCRPHDLVNQMDHPGNKFLTLGCYPWYDHDHIFIHSMFVHNIHVCVRECIFV